MSDDLRRRLDDAGSRPAPDPDPAFADALEARLRTVAAAQPATPGPSAPKAGREGPARAWRLLLGGGVLGAAAMALAFALLLPRSSVAPELVAPVNVEVSLAGGATLEDPVGLVLPEGAVIRVGAGGSARIGDVVLGPGDRATVHGGRLEVDRAGAGANPGHVPSSVSVAQVSPGPSRRPVPSPTPRPTATPGAPATRSPSHTPRPTSRPTSRPATPTPEPTAPPPTATPAPTPTPTPTPAIVRPHLRAHAVTASRFWATWTATFRARKYVLIATVSRGGKAAFPAYPGSRILGTYAKPPATRLRFPIRAGVTQIKLRVIALRANGTVLRRSNVVTLTVPRASPAAAPPPTPASTPAPTPGPSAP